MAPTLPSHPSVSSGHLFGPSLRRLGVAHYSGLRVVVSGFSVGLWQFEYMNVFIRGSRSLFVQSTTTTLPTPGGCVGVRMGSRYPKPGRKRKTTRHTPGAGVGVAAEPADGEGLVRLILLPPHKEPVGPDPHLPDLGVPHLGHLPPDHRLGGGEGKGTGGGVQSGRDPRAVKGFEMPNILRSRNNHNVHSPSAPEISGGATPGPRRMTGARPHGIRIPPPTGGDSSHRRSGRMRGKLSIAGETPTFKRVAVTSVHPTTPPPPEGDGGGLGRRRGRRCGRRRRWGGNGGRPPG